MRVRPAYFDAVHVAQGVLRRYILVDDEADDEMSVWCVCGAEEAANIVPRLAADNSNGKHWSKGRFEVPDGKDTMLIRPRCWPSTANIGVGQKHDSSLQRDNRADAMAGAVRSSRVDCDAHIQVCRMLRGSREITCKPLLERGRVLLRVPSDAAVSGAETQSL